MTVPATAPAALLVHGGRHGGWCWDRMVPLLRDAGFATHQPTLTGLGERRHLLDRSITLSTHVTDLELLVEHRDLSDVVLVAHSYGGMVATGLVDRMPDRFRHVVYLDSIVPTDGESVLDLIEPDLAAAMRASVEADGDGWRLPSSPAVLDAYGVREPSDVAWAGPRLSDQPFATYTEPLALTGAGERVPRSFVWFSRSAIVTPDALARFRGADGWGFAELPVEHDAIITDPREVTSTILRLVT